MSSRWISSARNRARRLAALALLLGFAATAEAKPEPADTVRFPFVAALSRVSDGHRVYFCAGTLVAPRWVLTAAHCFFNRAGVRIPESDLWIEAGAGDLNEVPDAAQVGIDRVVIHPDFDPATQANDIALVRLPREVGPLVADLARAGRDPERGIVLGFSSLYEGELASHAATAQAFSRLRQADVAILPVARCGSMLPSTAGPATARLLCAGAEAREGCIGDSGAPLVLRGADGSDRLGGIVSLGADCAGEAPLAIFTRVSAYAPWISRVLAGR